MFPPGEEMLDRGMWSSKRYRPNTSFQTVVPVYTPTTAMRVPGAPHPPQHLLFSISAVLVHVYWYHWKLVSESTIFSPKFFKLGKLLKKVDVEKWKLERALFFLWMSFFYSLGSLLYAC